MLKRAALASTTFIVACAVEALSLSGATQDIDANRVYASFDLSRPAGGPFPSDIFTVEDLTQNTASGELPAARLRGSPNGLRRSGDGQYARWLGLQPRISIPFTGEIDPKTLNSDTVFLIDLLGGARIGINQLIWDPATLTLHAESDEVLDQHHSMRDRHQRRTRHIGQGGKGDERLRVHGCEQRARVYQARLKEVFDVARAQGLRKSDIVSASAFTTQSVTSVMERIRDSIKASTPAPADFLLGPAGEPTVFPRSQVLSARWIRQTSANPPGFSPQLLNLAPPMSWTARWEQ